MIADDETPEEEAGESAEIETAEDTPNIENLAKLDDVGLMEVLGLNKKCQEARDALDFLVTLKGEERDKAEERVARWFEPNVTPSDFKYLAEDVKSVRKRGQRNAMDDCSPSSVL